MTDDERDDMDGAAHAAKVLRGVVTRLGRIEVIAALETLVAALDTAHAEVLELRKALEFIATHFSSDWPERCQSNVLTARKVSGWPFPRKP